MAASDREKPQGFNATVYLSVLMLLKIRGDLDKEFKAMVLSLVPSNRHTF